MPAHRHPAESPRSIAVLIVVAWLAATQGGWHVTWVFNLLCCLCGACLAWMLPQRWWVSKV